MQTSEQTSESQSVFNRLCELNVGFQRLNLKCERDVGLSLVQWYVLQKLHSLPATCPMDLAKECQLHASTLTPMIRRLERKGCVRSTPHELDRRRRVLMITRTGVDALRDFEARVLSRPLEMSSDVLSELLGALQSMVKPLTKP